MIVYLIKNKLDGKCYVGKSKYHLEYRWKEHIYDSKRSKLYFHNAIRREGQDSFDREILSKANSIEQMNQLEKLWIIALRTYDNQYGYNLTYGGDGAVFNQTTRKKISELHKGVPQSPEHRKRNSECRLGIPRPRTAVEKSAAGHRNKQYKVIIPYKERGAKTAAKLKGRIPPQEEIIKNSEAVRLKWMDPVYREKQMVKRRLRRRTKCLI